MVDGKYRGGWDGGPCPECGGNVLADPATARPTCTGCGLVVDELALDPAGSLPPAAGGRGEVPAGTGRGPARAVGAGEPELGTVVGAPGGHGGRDAAGGAMGARQGSRARKLARTQARAARRDAAARSRELAREAISAAVAALQLPPAVKPEAERAFGYLHGWGLYRGGNSLRDLFAAATYGAARQLGVECELRELAKFLGAKRRRAYKLYEELVLSRVVEPKPRPSN
ncbi:MAG: hypothetical protein Kow0069_33790 [Promethearchaeota archaeon]